MPGPDLNSKLVTVANICLCNPHQINANRTLRLQVPFYSNHKHRPTGDGGHADTGHVPISMAIKLPLNDLRSNIEAKDLLKTLILKIIGSQHLDYSSVRQYAELAGRTADVLLILERQVKLWPVVAQF
jgi:hypothetical protein